VSSRPRRSADVIIADWSRGKIRRAIVRPLEESRHVLRGRPYVTAGVLRGTFSVSGFLASRQVRGFPSRVSFAIASDSGGRSYGSADSQQRRSIPPFLDSRCANRADLKTSRAEGFDIFSICGLRNSFYRRRRTALILWVIDGFLITLTFYAVKNEDAEGKDPPLRDRALTDPTYLFLFFF